MRVLRELLKKIVGPEITRKIVAFNRKRFLKRNFLTDYKLYKKDSTLFEVDTYDKIACEITLDYHSIEKGFLHNPIRYRFAKQRVENLIRRLLSIDIHTHKGEVHIQSALINLCAYYELHSEANVNIADYFSKENYLLFKKYLILSDLRPVKSFNKVDYFSNMHSDFKTMSIKRNSIRSFTGEKIDDEILEKVVSLANYAPSVCNRQAVSVYIVENKKMVEKILEIQGGLAGYSDALKQVMIITVNRSFFYSVGERYQPYIDGGLYTMNLLYSLNYYEIAACPIHWAKTVDEDDFVQKIIGSKKSEKIVCMIAIGMPTDKFETTLSLKRPAKENLHIVK